MAGSSSHCSSRPPAIRWAAEPPSASVSASPHTCSASATLWTPDHIAAIDNTTRKFVTDGTRARTVGFWFSLGHSSVVLVLCLLVTFGVRALVGALGDDSSSAKRILGFVGTLVGGGFLMLIGLLNLQAMIGIGRLLRRMRREPLDEVALERQLASRGLFARVLGRCCT